MELFLFVADPAVPPDINAADRICRKRLKAALPHLVESMERHGHLALDPEVRVRLLAASAATLDRVVVQRFCQVKWKAILSV